MLGFSGEQLALLAFLAGVWGAAVTALGQWGTLRRPEIHHFYWGLLALFLANALATFLAPGVVVTPIEFAGIALVTDDAIQHAIQALQLVSGRKVTFRSPLHELYVWAARRALARWPSLARRFPFLFR